MNTDSIIIRDMTGDDILEVIQLKKDMLRGKEGLKIALKLDLALQFFLAVARQPADDLVNFFLRTVLAFGLLNIQWINAGKFHSIYTMLRHNHFSNYSSVNIEGLRSPTVKPTCQS